MGLGTSKGAVMNERDYKLSILKALEDIAEGLQDIGRELKSSNENTKALVAGVDDINKKGIDTYEQNGGSA